VAPPPLWVFFSPRFAAFPDSISRPTFYSIVRLAATAVGDQHFPARKFLLRYSLSFSSPFFFGVFLESQHAGLVDLSPLAPLKSSSTMEGSFLLCAGPYSSPCAFPRCFSPFRTLSLCQDFFFSPLPHCVTDRRFLPKLVYLSWGGVPRGFFPILESPPPSDKASGSRYSGVAVPKDGGLAGNIDFPV